MVEIRIGTCHWKYPSWVNLVYSKSKGINYLQEYARKYNTVEIDQWFWSLFAENQVVLPLESTVAEYVDSVPKDFIFTIKVPNSITLTHFYPKEKKEPLRENPHFLSVDLFNKFLEKIAPMQGLLGPLMFQFEYLNKTKMAGLDAFISLLKDLFNKIPKNYSYGIEIRNPNYLLPAYFNFLKNNNISHVFLQGYFMPDIVSIYEKYKEYISGCSVIRLHGPHRGDMEKKAGNKWDKIIENRDEELRHITEMVQDMLKRGVDIFLNVNNHYEGSSPLTIERIKKLIP
jgi:uncharacterized protein YecE (DUF72 family)